MIKKYDEIERVSNRFFRPSNQSTIEDLQEAEQMNGFPTNLLVGIYLIESGARPLMVRTVEYLCVLAGVVGQILFHKPVKSYTIGKYQLGLPEILNYIGVKTYLHSPYVTIPIRKILPFLKALRAKEQVEILVGEIMRLHKKAANIYGEDNVDKICIFIGEQYNGRYSYGLLLGSVVSTLSEWLHYSK